MFRLLAFMTFALASLALESVPASAAGKLGTYIHPERLFSLSLPEGVIRGHPERYRLGAPDLVVRSDAGFVLSVESRRLSMSGSERDVLEKLERLYMGPGRPWSKRLQVTTLALGGLPGIRAVYSGPETDGIVAVARGRNTDFLLMFFTPTGLRDRLAPQFDWVLDRFDVSRDERRDLGSPLVRAPVIKAPGVFRHAKLGYTLRYPKAWAAVFVPPYAAVFTPPGSDGRDGVRIRIENIVPGKGIQAADAVLTKWRDDLAAAADKVTFTAAKPLVVQTPSGTRVGMTAVADYTHNGAPYRQWAAVIPRTEDGTVHLWRYDSPQALFAKFQEDADAMLRSLVMEAPSAR